MLPDVVLGCLHGVLPDQVPAEGASCIWNPVFLNGVGSGTGENVAQHVFVINPIFNGGTGARPHKDGLSTTAFPSGVRTTSSEVNEATSPLVVWRKEYAPDSGGAGLQRGGLGQIIEVAHRQRADFVISKMFDRLMHAARGRLGGRAGKAGRVFVRDESGIERDLPGKGRDLVDPGAMLVMQTPGGGGIGDPAERSKARLEADLRAGYVTPEGATADYGVTAAD
jgi:N-methylhydantoinase B